MTEALIWIAVLAFIPLMIWLLLSENDRRKCQTAAEWEREYAAGQGKVSQFMHAGALGLEGIFVAEKQAAIAFKKDEEQGMTKTGTKGDDQDRTTVSDDGES